MELLYHVTPEDTVLGAIDRDRAHAEGLLHRSGMVFLVRSDGRVLIQRRNAERQTYPDCYDSSCSFHVTFGETYEEAAKRELTEETGVSAPLRYLGKFTHDPPENETVAVFACYSDDQIQSSEKEFSSASFLTKEQIDEIVALSAPWLRDGWKLAREKI